MSKFCSKCGAEAPDDAGFCLKCGSAFPEITEEIQELKKGEVKAEPVVSKNSSSASITDEKLKKKKKGCLSPLLIVVAVIAVIIGFMSCGGDTASVDLAKSLVFEGTDGRTIGEALEAQLPGGSWTSEGSGVAAYAGKDAFGHEWKIRIKTDSANSTGEILTVYIDKGDYPVWMSELYVAIMDCLYNGISQDSVELLNEIRDTKLAAGNTEKGSAPAVTVETTTQAVQAAGDREKEDLESLKEDGLNYGFNTVLANVMAGLIDLYREEEKSASATLLNGGLNYVDQHNEYFPVRNPGIDYFTEVDFNIQKRVIDKYPDDNYGLMHVVGSVNGIEYDTGHSGVNDLLNTDGFTLLEMAGYCESSNMYEDIIVYFLDDLSFAYQGSSLVVLGTPIAKISDNGSDALVVLGSFVATADADYTGQIFYGLTETEASMSFMGGWYFQYMSPEKMQSETIRLNKEKLGYDDNSTDADILPKEFEGNWFHMTEPDFISIYPISKASKDFKELSGQYEYVVDVNWDNKYPANVNGNKMEYDMGDGNVGILRLSFSPGSSIEKTYAKEYLKSDKTMSEDGIYLVLSGPFPENKSVDYGENDLSGLLSQSEAEIREFFNENGMASGGFTEFGESFSNNDYTMSMTISDGRLMSIFIEGNSGKSLFGITPGTTKYQEVPDILKNSGFAFAYDESGDGSVYQSSKNEEITIYKNGDGVVTAAGYTPFLLGE